MVNQTLALDFSWRTDYKLVRFLINVVAIAQLVEHGIVIPRVAGSSPVGHPNFFSLLHLTQKITLRKHITSGINRLQNLKTIVRHRKSRAITTVCYHVLSACYQFLKRKIHSFLSPSNYKDVTVTKVNHLSASKFLESGPGSFALSLLTTHSLREQVVRSGQIRQGRRVFKSERNKNILKEKENGELN